MIDLDNETVITFSQAARLVPGGGVHRASVARWTTKGVRGVWLESEIIAGRTVTSVQALDRFLTQCRQRRWAGLANVDQYERAMAAKSALNRTK